MGQQIIQQPDGLFAVFSTVTDSLIITDATPEELVEWRAEQAAERARESARTELKNVMAGEPWKSYYFRVLTWDEVQEMEKQRKEGYGW
jgi:hypothetical protein